MQVAAILAAVLMSRMLGGVVINGVLNRCG